MKLPNWVIPGSAVFFLGACTALLSPIEQSRSIATQAGFTEVRLPDARLRAYLKHRPIAVGEGSSVTVYIESDGAPWRLPDEPPADPTPHKPMVLKDGSVGPVALGRLSRDVRANTLNRRNSLPATPHFGCVAASAKMPSPPRTRRSAASRGDRCRAGESRRLLWRGLDGGAGRGQTRGCRLPGNNCRPSRYGRLDPCDRRIAAGLFTESCRYVRHGWLGMPQTHFRGAKDDLVPPRTSARFLKEAPGAKVINKADFDHACCWEDAWAQLRAESCLGP
jgi:hypothetical protein